MGKPIRQRTASRNGLDSPGVVTLALDRKVCVETFIAIVQVAFAGTVALAGLKLHVELAGRELHAKVKLPAEPFSGVRDRV